MNGYYNDYNHVVIETPEERQNKRKKQRNLFSRVFLALSIYIITTNLVSNGIYLIARSLLSAEKYQAFIYSSTWTIIISCAVQYLIAFPIFILSLAGTKKSESRERAKLSLTDFLLLFLIGEALMFAGNFIGTFLNQAIGNLTGRIPENGVSTIVNETPIWLIFILMVICAPIVEELIFRKLLIDRLSFYGDHIAIIFSAVAFGLMHGNLYQFFYATLLGGLLGYVYTSTRDVKYTIFIHMVVNFMGSIVAIPVQNALTEFYEALEVLLLGHSVNIISLLVNAAVVFIYTNMQYGMIIGGIIALVHFIRKKKINVSRDKEIYLPDSDVVKHGLLNVGVILFIVITLTTTILNLLIT